MYVYVVYIMCVYACCLLRQGSHMECMHVCMWRYMSVCVIYVPLPPATGVSSTTTCGMAPAPSSWLTTLVRRTLYCMYYYYFTIYCYVYMLYRAVRGGMAGGHNGIISYHNQSHMTYHTVPFKMSCSCALLIDYVSHVLSVWWQHRIILVMWHYGNGMEPPFAAVLYVEHGKYICMIFIRICSIICLMFDCVCSTGKGSLWTTCPKAASPTCTGLISLLLLLLLLSLYYYH